MKKIKLIKIYNLNNLDKIYNINNVYKLLEGYFLKSNLNLKILSDIKIDDNTDVIILNDKKLKNIKNNEIIISSIDINNNNIININRDFDNLIKINIYKPRIYKNDLRDKCFDYKSYLMLHLETKDCYNFINDVCLSLDIIDYIINVGIGINEKGIYQTINTIFK